MAGSPSRSSEFFYDFGDEVAGESHEWLDARRAGEIRRRRAKGRVAKSPNRYIGASLRRAVATSPNRDDSKLLHREAAQSLSGDVVS